MPRINLSGVVFALGSIPVAVPVVLAPMAGITNVAFRQLCREALAQELNRAPEAPASGAQASGAQASGTQASGSPASGSQASGSPAGAPGLFVSEMITTRALVERDAKTLRLIQFDESERPRSLQLYGVDPEIVGAAVRMVVQEDRADHIDLNFGCPAPKVTRKGGGAALPWRIGLFEEIVRSAVRNADGVPVSVKMRLGIDDGHLTYQDAALRAQDAGAVYVALHGRTAAQHYSGEARWAPIAELVDLLDIPVLGNGDIWEADDALRMVRETGCAGVVVGRGCLGRPWLFADLAAAFTGRSTRTLPSLHEVTAVMRRHAQLLAQLMGEARGLADFRKHVAWYLKGFAVGAALRSAFASVSSMDDFDRCAQALGDDQPFPAGILGQPRGRTTALRSVALPEGWLAARDGLSVPRDAELATSGG